MWKNIDSKRKDSAYYSVMRLTSTIHGMDALRATFPDGEANDLNAVLFSTSGVHGTYNTIEEAEVHITNPGNNSHAEVTFLILHPRTVTLRYGTCQPESQADIEYLKRLRATSHAAIASIGLGHNQ